ncbi:MAG: conjugal transfer protein TraX [Clostridiales bacterium]|nr:conjugal transfer protein TraX [Clostridiales bacterium]MDY4173345.1 TraX family protein [Evtepia sp.]
MPHSLAVRPTGQAWGLTDTGLKAIALVSMVLDHIHYFFSHTGCIPLWFSMAGRLAAPLFLFCLVEGYSHTHSRRRYYCKLLAIAAPMGLLLFFMRYGGLLVRPDGFFPTNSMLSTFVLLVYFYLAFDCLASRRGKRVLLGLCLLVFLLAWPFLAGWLTLAFPAAATVVGLLSYTGLPMINLTGDLSTPVLLSGIVLYLARKHRPLQVAALVAVEFGWHFLLVYSQVRTLPDFQPIQMLTTYYEWMGGCLAAPLLLCYNGQRGRGYQRFFYFFYPAHIYLLYALSWLSFLAAG